MARELSVRGFHVFASVRDTSKAAHFVNDPAITVVELDVASLDSVKNAASEVSTHLPDGKLDILVNNAGMAHSSPLVETDLARAG